MPRSLVSLLDLAAKCEVSWREKIKSFKLLTNRIIVGRDNTTSEILSESDQKGENLIQSVRQFLKKRFMALSRIHFPSKGNFFFFEQQY